MGKFRANFQNGLALRVLSNAARHKPLLWGTLCTALQRWERYHVYPTWGAPHDVEGWHCWCGPTVEEYDHASVIIHREPAS